MRNYFTSILIALSVIGIAGCGQPDSPEVKAIREKRLVATPPAKERPVADVRKDLKSGAIAPEDAFVIRARINAGDFPPFAEGMAAFVVTDATGHDGDESHNPHECPFCKRDIKNVIARVEFRDEANELIRIDTRQLFNVKEFDLLVIEGTGKFDDDDTLIIQGQRMYVKR